MKDRNRLSGNGHENPTQKKETDRGGTTKPKKGTVPKPHIKVLDIDGLGRYLLNKIGPIITKGPKWWRWNDKMWEPTDPLIMPAREAYKVLNKDHKSEKNAKSVLGAVNLMCQKTDDEIKLRNAHATFKINLKNCTLIYGD